MTEESVLLHLDGAVATVELNRPKALNALDAALADGLVACFGRIAGDRRVRVVVLKGAGAGFMAGGDIRGFQEMMHLLAAEKRREFERFVHRAHPVILAMRHLPLPIIAAVHGAVAGFGMSLMLAADLAIAAEDAFFTLAYCHLGTSPDGGATYFLPRHVGSKKAMEIALLGDRFDSAAALRWGLVNEVVGRAALADRVAALAARLADGPAAAYAATKRLFDRSAGASLPDQLQAEAENFAQCAASDDFAEGVAAFIGKRPPIFTKP
ncbi:MAG: enoyl-CoA hydratase/isomerase family protein [Alphaproteobacteria bacterium]|nr:enoyl-CoA hydratase/isomerase family protein [Alphaproteobacteria bacterium]